jgi:hypothetical protein
VGALAGLTCCAVLPNERTEAINGRTIFFMWYNVRLLIPVVKCTYLAFNNGLMGGMQQLIFLIRLSGTKKIRQTIVVICRVVD